MTDIIKRLREEAQDIRANLPNVKTPLFAMKLSDLSALLSEAAQLLERGSWKPIPLSDEVVRYVSRYGGRCRDCADNSGICPGSGLPCGFEDDDPDKAIRHVISALNYGFSNGFLALSPDPAFLGEIEEASREKPTTCAPDGSPPVHAPRGSLPEDGDR